MKSNSEKMKEKTPALCYICGKEIGEYGTLCKKHKSSESGKQTSFEW